MDRHYGRYTVVATLGSGGMGDVFRARDERLGREVAVKTVRNVVGLQVDTFRARFDAEARALAALSHPAIVQVFDLGIEGDEPYLVMELVDGPSLKAKLEGGTMSEGEVRGMGIQLARGLEAAHGRHILHRDIKPANILLSPTGQWKLADFGIARVPDSDLTLAGQFLGTPAFAAPEALTLGEFSEKSDVFSLAVTMLEALTGKRMRGTATVSDAVDAPIEVPPEVPPGLARALRPALARSPGKRPSAARFAELLAGAEEAPDADATRADAPRARKAPPALEPEPAAKKAAKWPIVVAIGGLAVIAVIVAVSRGGGVPARPAAPPDAAVAVVPVIVPDAMVPPDAAVVAPDAMPVRHRKLPPVVRGQVVVIYPEDISREAHAAYQRIADAVYDRDLAAAVEALDAYEAEFGRVPESQHMRSQINAQR